MHNMILRVIGASTKCEPPIIVINIIYVYGTCSLASHTHFRILAPLWEMGLANSPYRTCSQEVDVLCKIADVILNGMQFFTS